MRTTADTMKLLSALLSGLILLDASVVAAQTAGQTARKILTDVRSAAQSCAQGARQSTGHAGDKAIECMIQTVTPEADEATRAVQRNAVKYMVDPSPTRSQQHMDRMLSATRAAAGGSSSAPSSGARGVSAARSGSPNASAATTVVRQYRWNVTANGGTPDVLEIVELSNGTVVGTIYGNEIRGRRLEGNRFEFVRYSSANQTWIGTLSDGGHCIAGNFYHPGNGMGEWWGSTRATVVPRSASGC